ncbi:MAG: ABC transporter permease [Acidobacteria bacterium]|nr:ABC transporter permease [Acidobacteriota bacterium]
MNWIRVWAVARKEFLHVLRDARSLAMAIAFPTMLLILYGYALTLDVDRVPMVVWDQSRSPASREFLSGFYGSRYFALRGHIGSYPELETAIDRRQALLALVIPSDFARHVESHRPASVQMIVDGGDSTTATLAIGYAEAATQSYSQQIQFESVQFLGGRRPDPPLELRSRVWYNEELQSRNYIIPGLIAIVMMVIAAMLTSLTVAREWERGTMEQLISTPIQGRELVLGKLLPYFAIAMLDVLLAVGMSLFVFQVPLRGSLALLLAVAALFQVGALSLGLLISIATKNQLLANQLAMMTTFLPSFLLSGFVYAIPNMPKALQLFTYVVPARYFVSFLKGVYLKGIGLKILAGEVLLIILFAVVMVVLADRRFQKKLE